MSAWRLPDTHARQHAREPVRAPVRPIDVEATLTAASATTSLQLEEMGRCLQAAYQKIDALQQQARLLNEEANALNDENEKLAAALAEKDESIALLREQVQELGHTVVQLEKERQNSEYSNHMISVEQSMQMRTQHRIRRGISMPRLPPSWSHGRSLSPAAFMSAAAAAGHPPSQHAFSPAESSPSLRDYAHLHEQQQRQQQQQQQQPASDSYHYEEHQQQQQQQRQQQQQQQHPASDSYHYEEHQQQQQQQQQQPLQHQQHPQRPPEPRPRHVPPAPCAADLPTLHFQREQILKLQDEGTVGLEAALDVIEAKIESLMSHRLAGSPRSSTAEEEPLPDADYPTEYDARAPSDSVGR
ncbi:hypothetical protein DIPPA_34119 [Diplonema papillatum]|nr:hypothetical protein DIPPA_34119 [Diplonema papillatum]